VPTFDSGGWPQDAQATLAAMEQRLDVADICFYRSMAYAALKAENAKRAAAAPTSTMSWMTSKMTGLFKSASPVR